MRVKRGTFRIKRGGYWAIKKWDHPFCGKQGYVMEHRLIMEEKLGRVLFPSETVHHKDGNTLNNSLENLELFSSHGEHTAKAHAELFARQKIIFAGKRFSKKTEFTKGNTPWNKGTTGVMPRAWNKGKPWSLETREKMRTAALKRWNKKP